MKTSQIQTKIKTIAPSAKVDTSFDSASKIIVGDKLFVQTEHVEWNMHRYSRGWHRTHGGVKEVSDRKITIYNYNGRAKNKLQLAAVVEFNSWRGNILLQTIKQSGLFAEPESTAPMAVRLDKFYGAEIIRTIGHINIFERILLGNHVDYCAVFNGVTFHADTVRSAVRGVHVKIKAAFKKTNSPIKINAKLCKELGFCDTGVKQFCNLFSIDINGSYSPAEIEKLVKSDLDKAAPFETELRTIANSLNYKISV